MSGFDPDLGSLLVIRKDHFEALCNGQFANLPPDIRQDRSIESYIKRSSELIVADGSHRAAVMKDLGYVPPKRFKKYLGPNLIAISFPYIKINLSLPF